MFFAELMFFNDFIYIYTMEMKLLSYDFCQGCFSCCRGAADDYHFHSWEGHENTFKALLLLIFLDVIQKKLTLVLIVALLHHSQLSFHLFSVALFFLYFLQSASVRDAASLPAAAYGDN